ncbi:hypothetical protein ARMGADRAFT_1090592 [Armillaria gallica]|uniref:F-box domain-containing protein n=1 Tax=Armillaria gallica TaxID=47427 RepID=A0A2H3D1N5_ARMGA|nr:hypothetical protein ARMGADRAFT_1090592 [Armillaria gallica]
MTTPVGNSVSGDSSPSVPQELIEYILDFLHDDIPTLRTCSLVSRCAFLPRSSYHIYSSVFIVHTGKFGLFREQYAGQLYRCRKLAALLKDSPHIAPLVTQFGILAMADLSFMTKVFADTSLNYIIQSFRKLSHIEFVAGQNQGSWADFPDATRKSFLRALRSLPLKTLTLKGIEFNDTHLEDVFTAAAKNAALKHLTLVCCYKGAGTSQLSNYPPICPPTNGLPALESLSISRATGPEIILQLFFTHSLYSISSIQRLSLQIRPGTPSSFFQSLLNETRKTLECFTLDIYPLIGGKVCFDLSRHGNLSSFCAILPDPPSILEMRLSPTLRTLSVKHVSRAWKANLNDSVRAWAKVGQLSLPALERAHIRLSDSVDNKNYYRSHCHWHTCGHQAETADHDTWKREVEESMPSAWKDKNFLIVEVVKEFERMIPRLRHH